MASQEIYELAVEEVTLRNKSLRDAANSYDLIFTSLYRFIQKKKAFEAGESSKPPSVGYSIPTVFSEAEEEFCSDANFGLTPKEARALAYKLAVKYNNQFPESWQKSEMAGEVWFNLFRKRYPVIALKMPQPISISRVTSFNKSKVELFF